MTEWIFFGHLSPTHVFSSNKKSRVWGRLASPLIFPLVKFLVKYFIHNSNTVYDLQISILLFNSQQTSSSNAAAKDVSVVENGVESKPSKDDTDNVVDGNCEEQLSTTDTAEADVDVLDKRKSPELPMPELPTADVPSPDVQDADRKGNLTDDEEQLTPSGTLSRHGTLDE